MKRPSIPTVSTIAALLMSAFVPAQDPKAATVTVEVRQQVVERPVAGADAEGKVLEPVIRGFVVHLRPFFRTELRFIDSLCGLSKEQREAFARDADATVLEVAKAFAGKQREIQQKRWQDGPNNLDPRFLMQAAMLERVQARLTPEQSARYKVEVGQRAADRKQVSVDNIVAQMDIELELTADQRARIASAIAENWDDAWDQSLVVYRCGPHFLPNIPAKLVDAHLNDAQKKLWRETPCSRIFYSGYIGFLFGLVTDAEVLEDGTLILHGMVGKEIVAAGPRGEGPEEDAAPAEARAMREPGVGSDWGGFDESLFYNMGRGRAVRANWDARLKVQIDNLDRACTLTGAQKKTLQLAGYGHVKRLFDEYAEKKEKYKLVDMSVQGKINDFWDGVEPLRAKFEAGSFDDGSLFAKVIRKTLDKPQTEKYEAILRERAVYRYRSRVRMAVSMIDCVVAMRGDQRARLEEVLLDDPQIPRRFGQYDFYVVLYQIWKLPEARIRPIFDAEQWPLVSRKFRRVTGMHNYIGSGDFLPKQPKSRAVEAGGRPAPAAPVVPAAGKKD